MIATARFLPLILKNSWRNRRRTVLTVLSVGVFLCQLGVLMAMYRAFYFAQPTPHQARRLVTRNRVSLTFPIPIYYRDKIRQVSGVEEVMTSQWFGGVYKDARDPANFFPRFAIEPEKIFTIHGEMEVPAEEQAAFLRERSACLIGRELARRHNFKLGDRITIVGDIFPITVEFTVRAIYDAPENNENLYFHWKYLEESVSAGRRDWGLTGMFVILADSPDSVPRIAGEVDSMFRNATVQTRTESEQQFAISFLAFLGNVKAFLLSICAAVTFTILLVSGNTMAMSVRERIREVAILRTLGFTPGRVLAIILGESALLSLAGGALGLLLASGLCAVVRNGPAVFAQLRQLSIQPAVALAALGVAVLGGVLSSLAPAWNAARTRIVDGIRHAG